MNPKISGQPSKSNYHNSGSSANAVEYNKHDLEKYLDEAIELGAEEKQMQFFDMEGHIVNAAEVMDKIDRHHAGLHKDDAKFYCIMLDPSDSEIAAMGTSLKEQLSNGQKYVYDVMDAYAKNFHREGIEGRHNLTAYAIPHLYKGEDKKEQIHWHIIVARKDASNKFKLSPLTNHRSTTKGVVKGGFDRVAFDVECERLFDARFGYARKVEESFEYCLAQKKGTPEQKAEQTQRLAEQKRPDLEAAVNAFLNHYVAQLTAEATAKAAAEQKAKNEAERKERNEFWNDYHSKYRPMYNELKAACDNSFSMYREAKEQYGLCSQAISERYTQLRSVYAEMDARHTDVVAAKTAKGLWKAVSALVFLMNPVAGIVMGLAGSIVADATISSNKAARRSLGAQAASIRDSITNLKVEQVALRQDKADRLKVYVENKEAKTELQNQINRLKAELDKPEPKEQRTLQGFMEGYAKHVAEKEKVTTSEAKPVAESLSGKVAAYRRKSEILDIFRTSKDAGSLSLNLASRGLSIRERTSNRGVEDIYITAGGETPFTVEASNFGQEYLHQLLAMYEAASKRKPAYRTEQELRNVQRVRCAQNATQNAMEIKAAQEAAKKEVQRVAEQNRIQKTVNNNQSKGLGRK